MRKFFLFLALISNHTMIANAQDAPKELIVTLSVNQADLNVISRGLGSLPFTEVAPLMQKLQSQVTAQTAPKAVDANGNKAAVPVKK